MHLLRRKAHGQPIRAAIRDAGLSGPKLAAATRRIDPRGIGVSAAAIGVIAGRGDTSRDRCRLRTAWLVSAALGKPMADLFHMPPPTAWLTEEAADIPLEALFGMPTSSTATVERSIPDDHEG